MSKHRLWFLAAAALVGVAIVVQAAYADPDAEPFGETAVDGAGHTAVTRNLLDVEITGDVSGQPMVVLGTDGWVDFESFSLDDPDRVVIDLHGVISRLDEHSFLVGDGGVARVRAGQYRGLPDPVSRVVFDLDYPVEFDVVRDRDTVTVVFGQAVERSEEPVEIVEAVDAVETETRNDATVEVVEREVAVRREPAPQPLELVELEVDPTPEVATIATVVAVVEPEPSFEPVVRAEPVVESKPEPAGRSVEAETIETLLRATPQMATRAPARTAPAQSELVQAASRGSTDAFSTKTIVTDETVYTGKRISLNLVDADIKQLFRLFHDVSGLNFVLDPSVDGRVTVVLDNVPWDQALDLVLQNNGLDKVLENNVIRIAPTQKLAAEAAQRKALKEAKELEVEPITITRTLSYAKADSVEQVIREGGILSTRGRVIVDERTNTLIISDIPKKVEPLDALISTLDTETPQVMIEARIVETSRQFSRDLGIVWGFAAVADASRGTQTGLPGFNNASVRYGLNLPGGGGASTVAAKFGNIIDSFTLDIALNTLETEGRGRVLSAPKVATQNNERAEIEQGVRIPVVNTTATEINVEFVSASLRLEVTPQITAEGTIILDVTVENNSPDFQNTVGDVPPINTQRAQTKVLISDGGTTVIGGIFTVNEGRSEAGVPWFRKIPGLGYLFKSTSVTQQNRELLIFITPRIMKIG